mgnify:CR=1 FL=1
MTTYDDERKEKGSKKTLEEEMKGKPEITKKMRKTCRKVKVKCKMRLNVI